MYELIIIGAGPAGVSAAVYAARKRIKTLLATFEFGGQSIVSDDIQNWIGTPHISGANLAKTLRDHVFEYKESYVDVKEGVKVTAIAKKDTGNFVVTLDSGEEIESKAVLVTAGSNRRRLEIPGADRLEHKGLTYCASCDGPVFADMDVVVIGGGNAAFETVAQLVAYCKSVTLLNRRDDFRADPGTVEKIKAHPKVKIITNIEMVEVLGEKFVSGIKIKHKESGLEEILTVSGIFVEIGQIPNADFMQALVEKDAHGKIIIDPWTQQTSLPGLWAAGDVTNVRYHQNNIAAGDGVTALEDIYQWLHKNK